MRVGVTTSALAHVAILLWGLVSLPGAEPFAVEQIEALPVDIITDVTNISEGSRTAPEGDTQSQGEATPLLPRPDSTRIGNAPQDLEAPPTPTASETAAVPEAAPPPPPPPPTLAPPEPEPEPEVAAPPPPPPTPAPAPPRPTPPAPAIEELPPPRAELAELAPPPPEPEPEPPAPQAEPEPAPAPPAPPQPATPAATPVEETRPAPPVKPRSKPAPPRPVETASAEPSQPTRTPAETRPRTSSQGAPESTSSFDPNEIANLLNKVDPSGGGARASDRPASLGTATGRGAGAMTASEIDALRARIYECWNPPIGAAGETVSVPIRMVLNIDGTLSGTPVAMSVPGGPYGQIVAEAALRAVRRCAPYDFLPPEKFDSWSVVNINFSPPPSY
ncbi:cell envelope integrity protein TolA [Methylobrevis albus]|uniref:Cell envelope integrity protein TolA n=1 Tax=Methylobrevis albus TaxID=2793297 RepID=A0A931I4I0_9HYPH|nr:cell envelope integrity protein TolA [Methylobrevis albus]MBH0239369.1 cell envelope integrity protein TolA [Methylobrevis albus]